MRIRFSDILSNEVGGGYGSSIGSIVGLVVGYLLAPETFGTSAIIATAAVVAAAGGVVGAVIDNATTSRPSGPQPQIQDLAIQTTTYGTMIPKVYGRFAVAGNIIQTTDKVPHFHTTGGGGSGGYGGASASSTSITYTTTVAIGICKGPIVGISRVWADDTIVFPANNIKPFSPLVYEKVGQTLSGVIAIFTLYLGTETQNPDPFFESIVGVGNQPAYRGLAYIVIQHLELGSIGRVPNFRFEVYNEEEQYLPDVVRSICLDAGLTEDDITIQLGTNRINMLVTDIRSAKNIIEQLAEAFNFIAIESENKLKFSLKLINNAPIVYIPEDALSGGMDNPDQESLTVLRLQETDLPTKVTVNYASASRNYHTATQIIQLVNSRLTENPITMGFNIALNENQATRLSVALLYEPWTNRELVSGSLPFMCIVLDPFDFVSITSRNLTYLLRIIEMDHGNNWLYNFKSLEFDPELANTSIEATTVLPSPAEATSLSPAGIIILDAPPLIATDILPRYLAVAYPKESESLFTHASIYNSLDNTTYQIRKSLNIPGVTGMVAVALPTASQYVWDDVNTLTVDLDNPSNILLSHTNLEVLNGENRAMYGLECIAFGTAELIALGTYRLSHLLRGRQGTESQIDSHEANERFVLLDATATSSGKVPYDLEDVNVDEYYKVTDPFTNLATATAFQRTLNGVSVRPWAPVLLRAGCDIPSADDYTFYWYHRSRLIDAVWQLGSGLIYDPDDTGMYRIRIYTNNTHSVVKRTYTTTAFPIADDLRSYVYPIADQIVDFGSHQTIVYYSIQSLSSVNGYNSFGIARCT